MRKILLLCAMTVAVSLSACGGGSGNGNGVVADAATNVPSVVDSFFASVMALISGTPRDDTSPMNIDNVVLSQPENTNPTPVQ